MGTLYIVGTPIGNLEDITLRALRILQNVQLIAAEDTRKARILLDRHSIKTPVTSFFEGNERYKIGTIVEALASGDVALISEAGMPGISDPGYPLIQAAIARQIPVVPVPGPSAHTAALVVAGLPTDSFCFLGFLPRKPSERAARLTEVAALRATLVCYEAPHRLHATLEALRAILGNRAIALCRELTKHYEEIWRGDIEGALAHIAEIPPRGEYTLVVAGAPVDTARWDGDRVRAALAERLSSGLSRSQAAREVAALSGWSRRDIYCVETQAASDAA
ncbi:MAG TPA: 16S rRNA (cytidine(1402)-2'-O)-methyltransferase [Anaerolineae bacterium]|nr:16S rRNA (cytidine(1402)-2'-O)-methyltransferase [Anaerolineae bacterium]HQI86617.1 16S rRNA (cytidine(1402)-2'-O)-methyltransferase [Anaerolineae bacterium]